MEQINLLDKIYDYALEEVMADRFGRYSKYIIQDRAIPDVRDGLKPVQRRILYAMYKDRNTYDKPYRKSAKTVGNVMGNFHPHGDSSIYDAMVRMSQPWKMATPYIEMHGNNGSMDGDPAAAMRYTEARLHKISAELLKEIDKDTVEMAPNFDDTELEPTVLPAKFPNLLVNGATGISAGYATNMPPHNLTEVINATIRRIEKSDATLSEIMRFIKGPDFPTGGIVEGLDEIKKAYKTGKGKIVVKAKAEIMEGKNPQIIITEIPYDANKLNIVKKIEDIRLNKKIEGILEVRDETDKEGLRIAIDLKKGSKYQSILNYLYKNTDLQLNYSINNVAICNRTPRLVGLLEIIDYYIEFAKEIIIRRTKFDLAFKEKRDHILEGLVKCISILDEVIALIRASKNKADAIKNLEKEYKFTREQAEAIVNLQLYRLTNTDIVSLEEELDQLHKEIKALKALLNDEQLVNKLMIRELMSVRDNYGYKRKTLIKEEVEALEVDKETTIIKEDVMVGVTKDGYVKASNMRSYSQTEEVNLKEEDYFIFKGEATTLDNLIIYTNLGNYALVPVNDIGITPWKDGGMHLSNLISLVPKERIIKASLYKESDQDITISTRNGMIKRTVLKDLSLMRMNYLSTYMKLKKGDEVISIEDSLSHTIITTSDGYGLLYKTEEIPVVGPKAIGVKAINLKDSHVAGSHQFDDFNSYLTIFTENGSAKRMLIGPNFDEAKRAQKGVRLIKNVKSNPYIIVKSLALNKSSMVRVKTAKPFDLKLSELPICDKMQTGKAITKENIEDVYVLDKKEEVKEEIPVEDRLKEVDNIIKNAG